MGEVVSEEYAESYIIQGETNSDLMHVFYFLLLQSF